MSELGPLPLRNRWLLPSLIQPYTGHTMHEQFSAHKRSATTSGTQLNNRVHAEGFNCQEVVFHKLPYTYKVTVTAEQVYLLAQSIQTLNIVYFRIGVGASGELRERDIGAGIEGGK